MARVAVAGGTGQTGRQVVAGLERDGHEAVVLSRSAGVDLITGAGLAGVLDGVSAVVDVTSTPAVVEAETVEFFGTVTRNLLAAEAAAGVRHQRVSAAGSRRPGRAAGAGGRRPSGRPGPPCRPRGGARCRAA